jgi:hypothetical protein
MAVILSVAKRSFSAHGAGGLHYSRLADGSKLLRDDEPPDFDAASYG